MKILSKYFILILKVFVINHLSMSNGSVDILQVLYGTTNMFNESTVPDVNNFLMVYDFIIIGSGSGGSVMANRLTEIQQWNVLLLEAGEEENYLSDVPLTAAATLISRYNWGYRSDKVPGACLNLEHNRCNWPKGRALGGTSVINFMLYQRGHRKDYDNWAAQGNFGWSYSDVLPYFKKSERVGIPELMNSPYHGRNGYLDVQHSKYSTKLLELFLDGGRELGYNVTDPNGHSLLGFSRAQATMRNGRRCSAAKAFLRPIYKRKNLHISKNTRVTKILINPITKIAYGVEFIKNRKLYRVVTNKEVILSAGTIASPQILMLSGIGPREHLEQFKIPVVQNLKVGYNLHDHSCINGLAFMLNRPISISEGDVQNPRDIMNYLFRGQGPYTIPGGAEGLAFVKTPNSTYDSDYPDIEIVIGAGAVSGDISGSMRNMLGITEEFYQKTYEGVIGKPAFALVPVLLQPKSRGRVYLKSTNPFHWPHMQPNFFSDPRDLKQMIEGAKLCVKLSQTTSFRSVGSHLHKRPFLGCEQFIFQSDDYWECCIRRYASSLQHQVGTCKMGPSSDFDAVVNPQLQVYGVRNLRVVDASIMPTIPAAHTNAATFMIGEKAADMVKEFWQNSIYQR